MMNSASDFGNFGGFGHLSDFIFLIIWTDFQKIIEFLSTFYEMSDNMCKISANR